MKIREALKIGTEMLKINNIEEPNIKVRILISNVMNKPKEYILVHDDEDIDELKFLNGINKLKQNIPIQYIINNQEFMKLNFYVDENVLIPQPDTEILVEEVIDIINNDNKKSILDLCTGSGCIAISLANVKNNLNITATDISSKAIQIAKLNAEKNNVHKNITFIESNMFNSIGNEKFDIIVSNPPYIRTEIINTLSDEVKKEPKIALNGGEDGLKFYKVIANEANKYLTENGYLCLEIGYDQKDEVKNILKETGKYTQIYSKKDLSGNDRIIIAKKV